MANCVKLYKEKLKGTWAQCGASYADNDILGLYVNGFSYSGVDGEIQTRNINGKNAEFGVYLTGNEGGRCFYM